MGESAVNARPRGAKTAQSAPRFAQSTAYFQQFLLEKAAKFCATYKPAAVETWRRSSDSPSVSCCC
jgi:hypothetical protein